MTNQVTDHGLLASTMEGIRETDRSGIVEVVADKGYEDIADMVRCLENGMIPHVITEEGKDGYEMEMAYEAAEADLTSTKAEELKRALHEGQIPEVYQDVLEVIKIEEVRRKVVNEKVESEAIDGTESEMQEKEKEGYFVRDLERD